jgi:hypothetical protein
VDRFRSLFPLKASKVIVQEPPVKALPRVKPEVSTSIDESVLEDSYVYVHCTYDNPGSNSLIRIWKTTFLVDPASSARSPLVHAENISLAPQWTLIPDGVPFTFLLIFSGLPKPCRRFDLREEIPQPGGFLVTNIQRNETDVYHITIA